MKSEEQSESTKSEEKKEKEKEDDIKPINSEEEQLKKGKS